MLFLCAAVPGTGMKTCCQVLACGTEKLSTLSLLSLFLVTTLNELVVFVLALTGGTVGGPAHLTQKLIQLFVLALIVGLSGLNPILEPLRCNKVPAGAVWL